MNKSEMIDMVAEAADISKAAAGRAVHAVFEGVTNRLKVGDSVTLVVLGTFSVIARASRSGRNPLTDETIQIKASNMPKFKAGKELIDAVN